MTTFTHYNANYTQKSKDSIKLPEITNCPTELIGSTKQVAWAKQIRQNLFVKIEVAANSCGINPQQFYEVRMLRRAIYHETSAKFLIDNRNKDLHFFWNICQKAGKNTAMFFE
jgi:hypothetical protein